jgi:hypothetical protein
MDLLRRRDQPSGEDRTRPAGRPPSGTPTWSDTPEDPPPDGPAPGAATVVDPPPSPQPGAPPWGGAHDDPSDMDTVVERTVPTSPTPAVDRDHDGVDDRDEHRRGGLFRRDHTDHDRDRDGVDDRDERHTGRHEVVEDVVVTRWSIADLVVTLIGAALALAGAVGLVRAEVDSSWYDPVVGVAGADHTALLAAVELGVGVLIALAGIARRRVIATLLGVALAIAAAVAAIETPEVSRELAIEDWWAWTLCAAGVVVVLMALVPRKGRIRRVTGES